MARTVKFITYFAFLRAFTFLILVDKGNTFVKIQNSILSIFQYFIDQIIFNQKNPAEEADSRISDKYSEGEYDEETSEPMNETSEENTLFSRFPYI